MSREKDQARRGRRVSTERLCFRAAGVVFALFVADILIAKVQVMSGTVMPFHLGDWPQFLVLLVAVTLFVIGALAREKAENKRDDPRAQAGPPTEPASNAG